MTLGEIALPRFAHTGRRRVIEVRAPDLAFTQAEIDQIIAGRGLPARPAFVAALLDITGGWAAGVDIATRWLLPDALGGFNAAIADVRDFAVSIVLPSVSDELQRFLHEVAASDTAVRHVHAGNGARPGLVQDALDRQLLVPHPERRLRLHPYLAWALRTQPEQHHRAVPIVLPRGGVPAAPAA